MPDYVNDPGISRNLTPVGELKRGDAVLHQLLPDPLRLVRIDKSAHVLIDFINVKLARCK